MLTNIKIKSDRFAEILRYTVWAVHTVKPSKLSENVRVCVWERMSVCVCIGESVREWIGGRASRSMHIIKLWTAVQNIRNGFLVILYFHRCCLYRCICVIFAPRSLSECVRTCRFVVRCVYTYAGRALLCFHNQISMWECENDELRVLWIALVELLVCGCVREEESQRA